MEELERVESMDDVRGKALIKLEVIEVAEVGVDVAVEELEFEWEWE